jgi:murein DD-endopeptidase MepM/ murein hydrolase activator NlpD
VLLIALTTLAAGLPAQARPDDPRADKKRVDAQLARTGALLEAVSAQARAAATQLAEVNQALPPARERVAQAKITVIVAETRAATAQRQADAARAAWQQTDQQFAAAVEQVQVGRAKLSRFAIATFKGGDIAQFNLLLGARAPQELVQTTGYLQKIAGSKQRAVRELEGARRAAKQVANTAALARDEAERTSQQAKASLAAAQQARAEAEQAQGALTALAAQRKRAAAAAKEERADVLARYAELKEQSKRIAEQLRAWEANGRPTSGLRPGGQLLMPAKGWKSSDFGMRYDPYYGVWQLHAGVDIAADGGQPIYASAAGRVASAGWLGGYGNYTCIGHGQYRGKNVSTCYAHQSRILVHEGQQIRRGQLIGRVGTTGASTGYHLHFEVRLDGDPVQPLRWLPGCLC